jgi:hypothetical protein
MPHSDLDLALFYYDLTISETRAKQRSLVSLIIVHENAEPEIPGRPATCTPGEEITGAFLVWKGKSHRLPLSTTHLILLDCLARHRSFGQNAAQIAAALDREIFYTQHGSNAARGAAVSARTSRTAVRQQVRRIRSSMNELFKGKHIGLKAEQILRSVRTTTNEVKYQLNAAAVCWEHCEPAEMVGRQRSGYEPATILPQMQYQVRPAESKRPQRTPGERMRKTE